jgi:hypothetical protein
MAVSAVRSLMSIPLDNERTRKIRDLVLAFAKIDVTKRRVKFFAYAKDDRKSAGGFVLAWSLPLDRSIHVETPLMDDAPDGILCFVILHELAHLSKGFRLSCEKASALAVKWLDTANVVEPQEVERMARSWNRANDPVELTSKAQEVLRSRHIADPSLAELESATEDAQVEMLLGRL